MNADTVAALAEPGTRAKFEPLGIDVRSSTPDELGARVRSEIELWGPVIKAAGIKAE
jgi:tripartite-type tricarboxylate transporter receptor subunit TctC